MNKNCIILSKIIHPVTESQRVKIGFEVTESQRVKNGCEIFSIRFLFLSDE